MLTYDFSRVRNRMGLHDTTAAQRLRRWSILFCLSLVLLGVLVEVASAVEIPLPTKDETTYGDFPVVGRRIAVWVIAQLHLMFGAFVVGVPLFILIIEIMGARTKSQQYDDLAHEFTRLLSVAFSTTATFGGILVFFLIGLYPTFTNLLTQIFFPSMVVYVFLFFGESFSMYLYYYGWEALKGTSRRFGAVLGTGLLSSFVFYPFILSISVILLSMFGAGGGAAGYAPLVNVIQAYFGGDKPAIILSLVLTVIVFVVILVHATLPGRRSFLHSRKWMHICFGILLNYFGLTIMMIANSWATFMTSPTGIDLDAGVYRGNVWEAMNNFTWNPVNLHRFIANIAFGGSVVAAYAAFRFLASPPDSADRAHYDWMGYIGNFVAVIGLIPLPFAGYWLGKEIYSYDQQLGITMMGGIFSWLFILQAVLIGALFLGVNYYLWLGMERIPGSERYRRFTPIILGVLTVCFLVWLTPHSLVASLEEARKMGGAHHPLLGVFGVMSAKNTVVNIMILATFLSFLLYRRGNKGNLLPFGQQRTGSKVALVVVALAVIMLLLKLDDPFGAAHAPDQQAQRMVLWLFELVCILSAVGLTFANRGPWGQGLLFAMSALIVVSYGVYGYYVEAIVRIGFSVLQVSSVVLVLVMAMTIDIVAFRGAAIIGEIQWGKIPERSQYVLFLLATSFTWLMGLMGYARSGLRTHWHIFNVMRDYSSDAFTPTLGFACWVVSGIVLIFLLLLSFIFWLAHLGTLGHEEEDALLNGTGMPSLEPAAGGGAN
ncbi:MAG: cytochrome ubiquinol oxidase subunit I [bacterium]|nr:cytochrome ubiquinol oxidase subunit I [bacterium]